MAEQAEVRTGKKGVRQRRADAKRRNWPETKAWIGPGVDIGYFCAPRALPLIISLLNSKDFSGDKDLGYVYLELYARHRGEGVIEMASEDDHAYAAGYWTKRGIRSWRERMRLLAKLGFVYVKPKGTNVFGLVLLVHPTPVVAKLRAEGRIPEQWWTAYEAARADAGDFDAEGLSESSDVAF